jgi:hypothetical protein
MKRFQMEIFAREEMSSRSLTTELLNWSARVNLDNVTLSVENNDPRPTR